MKKFPAYFNALRPARQRLMLLALVMVFALLLSWSLSHNQIHFSSGYMPKYIGHTNDSLTLKK